MHLDRFGRVSKTGDANRREFLFGLATAGLTTVARAGANRKSFQAHEGPATDLRAYLQNEMSNAQIPGMQVAVARQGKVVFLDSFGTADIENPAPVTNSTVFQIASCTKAFVGVALMQLVEDGKLDLDAPVSRYLGNLPSAWRAVSVAQVASHTSGLPDLVSNLAVLRLIVEGDAQASWAKVQTLPLEFKPGEKFNYVQTNYVVLGRIIDVLTNESFGEFIRKRQLAAVGMPKTVFGDDHEVVLHSARTYTPYMLVDGKPKRTGTLYKSYIEFPAMLRTCGGLNSTAEEIARWLIALQNGALFKNKTSVLKLWTAHKLNDGKSGPWGLGGWVFERPRHPVFFSVGAAKSAFAVYPNDDLAVVVLTNLSADLWLQFLDGIAAQYLPDLSNST
jgi:CubicO group peptidase (beta-lactamase class C family)